MGGPIPKVGTKTHDDYASHSPPIGRSNFLLAAETRRFPGNDCFPYPRVSFGTACLRRPERTSAWAFQFTNLHNQTKIQLTRMKAKIVLLGLALAAILFAPRPAFATVTVQGWYHLGENAADIYFDSSSFGRRFAQAFNGSVGNGQVGATITPFGVGGPLDGTGFSSGTCLLFGPNGSAGGMWSAGGYNPPATNYGIEIWIMPQGNGANHGNSSWIFDSGSSGGVYFQIINNLDGTLSVQAHTVGNGNVQIGDSVQVFTNAWTHLALVVDE